MIESESTERVSSLCALWKSMLRVVIAPQYDSDDEAREEDRGTISNSNSTLRDYEFGDPPCRCGDWR
jgi:hypothetical protein